MVDEFPIGVLVAWGVVGTAYAAACVWLGVRFFNRRERWAKWMVVALAVTPVLYVLSSGPMAMIAFRSRVTVTPSAGGAFQATSEISPGNWFPIAYFPLFLAAEQSWGDSIVEYWMLFPHQRTVVEP